MDWIDLIQPWIAVLHFIFPAKAFVIYHTHQKKRESEIPLFSAFNHTPDAVLT
jgi:hypothetical protein